MVKTTSETIILLYISKVYQGGGGGGGGGWAEYVRGALHPLTSPLNVLCACSRMSCVCLVLYIFWFACMQVTVSPSYPSKT